MKLWKWTEINSWETFFQLAHTVYHLFAQLYPHWNVWFWLSFYFLFFVLSGHIVENVPRILLAAKIYMHVMTYPPDILQTVQKSLNMRLVTEASADSRNTSMRWNRADFLVLSHGRQAPIHPTPKIISSFSIISMHGLGLVIDLKPIASIRSSEQESNLSIWALSRATPRGNSDLMVTLGKFLSFVQGRWCVISHLKIFSLEKRISYRKFTLFANLLDVQKTTRRTYLDHPISGIDNNNCFLYSACTFHAVIITTVIAKLPKWLALQHIMYPLTPG